ncbi:hypothetical protein Leryth_004973 [Lithospermum erythrorhizon]|nr:hypothetical protein Leryth_004973 [Lithospermum erythrorhizon]
MVIAHHLVVGADPMLLMVVYAVYSDPPLLAGSLEDRRRSDAYFYDFVVQLDLTNSAIPSSVRPNIFHLYLTTPISYCA